MAGFWSGLSGTLRALDAIAGDSHRLDGAEGALRALQYRLHWSSELLAGVSPPDEARAAHAELADALVDARDATGEVAEALGARRAGRRRGPPLRMARRALPGAARPPPAGREARARARIRGGAAVLGRRGQPARVVRRGRVRHRRGARSLADVGGRNRARRRRSARPQAVTASAREAVLTLKWESGASRSWMPTCSRFFPVQLHVSAGGPGGNFSARSIRWRGLGRCRHGASEPLERLLAAQELDALEEPR